MNGSADFYRQNHRRQQAAAIGAVAIALMAGLLPRNERALFITPFPDTPKAFAAIIPTPPIEFAQDFGYDVVPRGPPRAYFARARRPSGPPVSFGSVPRSASSPSAVGGGDGLPFTTGGFTPDYSPASGSGPGFSQAAFVPSPAPLSFGPGGTLSPTTSSGDPAPGTSSGGVIVPAVPEPASWGMMLLGFFGIGGVLRLLRRTGSVQLQA